jgi:hypothetical protein
MINYNNLLKHKEEIRELYKEKFDNTKKEHIQILFKIWEMLKQNNDITLIDKRWRNLNYLNFS